MAIRWQKLDLKKAPNVRKEVDDAIRAYSDAIRGADRLSIDRLRTAFEARVEQLDEFYLHNESDERAALFNKQSLRLRRALHAALPPPGAGASPSTPASPSTDGGLAQQLRVSHLGTPPSAAPGAAPKLADTPSFLRASALGGAPTAASPSASPATPYLSAPSSAGSKASKPRSQKKPMKPLYAWEKTPEAAAGAPPPPPERKVRTTALGAERLVFVPSAVPGFYEQEQPQPIDPRYVDLRIVLSSTEYQVLSAMKRAREKQEGHDKRFQVASSKESEFLHSAAPYVDPSRIRNALYRAA